MQQEEREAWMDTNHRFLAPGARPLETTHLLLHFPDSGTAFLFLSERVTLLLILKETLKRQHGENLFSKDSGYIWFQILESKMLDATYCIRLATLFDTFQQRPTMLDTLARPVWVNENILEILTQRHTCQYNSKFKKNLA